LAQLHHVIKLLSALRARLRRRDGLIKKLRTQLASFTNGSFGYAFVVYTEFVIGLPEKEAKLVRVIHQYEHLNH
jgi:hypothetical protein